MRRFGIAVWGIGPHARRNIVPAILRCPQLELRGLCSRDAASVAELARELQCRYWAQPESMLADAQTEIVYVSTPIGLHAAHGAQVLAAGKHFWCEKPLASDLGAVESLLATGRERGLSVAEGFMYLYHPHFAALADLMRSGRLGDILCVGCRFGIPALDRPGFRLTPALGGGAFLDVGSYPISMAAALFGDDEPEIALAEISASESGIDCAGRAVLRYPRGVRALLEWGIDCAYRNEIDVWGRRGTLRSDFVFSKGADHVPLLRLRDARGARSTIAVPAANHFERMLSAFQALLHSAEAVERERERILRRAMLAQRIRIAARENLDARPGP